MGFADLVARVDLAALEHLGGEAIVYQPQEGDAATVTGLFDPGYDASLYRYEFAGPERQDPVLFLVLADLPADPDEDEPTITVRGTAYKVRERVRDGLGGIRLTLYTTSSP